jgi:hypothetical protein
MTNNFQAEGSNVQFWTPVTGTRTENAIYPRSELRETYADGRLRNWTYPEADNYLRATLAVNQVPSSGKIVIGQIHAYDSQKPLDQGGIPVQGKNPDRQHRRQGPHAPGRR